MGREGRERDVRERTGRDGRERDVRGESGT